MTVLLSVCFERALLVMLMFVPFHRPGRYVGPAVVPNATTVDAFIKLLCNWIGAPFTPGGAPSIVVYHIHNSKKIEKLDKPAARIADCLISSGQWCRPYLVINVTIGAESYQVDVCCPL